MWELIDPFPAFLVSSHLATESLKVAQGSALIATKLDLFPHKHSNCNMLLERCTLVGEAVLEKSL